MKEDHLKSLSKYLSYLLRHHPESIGLELDEQGWVAVEELISKANQNGKKLNWEVLRKVLEEGSKQRFILSEDEEYIRAGYGHSIDVNLALKPQTPPTKLFHGTAEHNIDSIKEEGLKPGNRNFVHLSASSKEAHKVGERHGRPQILRVEAGRMNMEGYEFYQSESETDIWLTKHVPAEFITF